MRHSISTVVLKVDQQVIVLINLFKSNFYLAIIPFSFDENSVNKCSPIWVGIFIKM